MKKATKNYNLIEKIVKIKEPTSVQEITKSEDEIRLIISHRLDRHNFIIKYFIENLDEIEGSLITDISRFLSGKSSPINTLEIDYKDLLDFLNSLSKSATNRSISDNEGLKVFKFKTNLYLIEQDEIDSILSMFKDFDISNEGIRSTRVISKIERTEDNKILLSYTLPRKGDRSGEIIIDDIKQFKSDFSQTSSDVFGLYIEFNFKGIRYFITKERLKILTNLLYNLSSK